MIVAVPLPLVNHCSCFFLFLFGVFNIFGWHFSQIQKEQINILLLFFYDSDLPLRLIYSWTYRPCQSSPYQYLQCIREVNLSNILNTIENDMLASVDGIDGRWARWTRNMDETTTKPKRFKNNLKFKKRHVILSEYQFIWNYLYIYKHRKLKKLGPF